MRVLIDGYLLDKPRGLGRYVREVVHALSIHAPDDLEICVALPMKARHLSFAIGDKVKFFELPSRPYPIWEQFTLPAIVRDLDADVCHCPYNTAPIRCNDAKYVVTIHDLIFEESLGTGWYQRLGNLYRRFVVRRIRHNSPMVITVSKASAALIRAQLGINPRIIYTPTETVGLSPYLKKRNATPLLLHFGGISPHKNTERVIIAFHTMAHPYAHLVVLGMAADSDLARKHASEKVIFPGWIDDETIRDYFAKASAVVFPSLVEGYGLPIIEGFTAGVPVVTSNRAPMSEIANNAALLVDPESVESIAEGMKEVLNNNVLASDLIEKGTSRLQQINSLNLCLSLVETYRAVVSAASNLHIV